MIVKENIMKVGIIKTLSKPASAAIMVAAALWSAGASAGTTCNGKVNYVDMESTGVVAVSLNTEGSNAFIYLCNLTESTNEIQAEACKGWYAGLLAAAQTQSPVEMRFNNSTAACSNLGYPSRPTRIDFKKP